MNNDILFSYRLGNADCCKDGDDDGFLFVIYSDGTAIYNKYVVHDNVKRSRKFKVSNKTVSEISTVLDKYERAIFEFDTDIDNGSHDGVFNIFTFRNKKISTFNINDHNIKNINNHNTKTSSWDKLKYFTEHRDIIIKENIIIKIFNEICAVLRKNHAIRLRLENVFIPLWLF